MEYVRGQIPPTNEANLQRLKDIRVHWSKKYEDLSSKRDSLHDKIDAMAEGFHRLTLERRLDNINLQMSKLYGQLENNLQKIEDLESYIEELKEREAPLTQKPFAEALSDDGEPLELVVD